MSKEVDTAKAREIRHRRVRATVKGTSARPRLNVFRSNQHIYAQIIDDTIGHTLVSASTIDAEIRPKLGSLSKTEQAKLVGQTLAKRALAIGVKKVVFDRGGYRYHGRVKSLADGSREGGLEF
ncbi:MAG: 50S ribosomal protein L18 [Anaerolineales bacterium]|jgi:large subunit ribosomal protein L18|nr:50S ribosomal protein L18 [Anaerolineae bacterium]